MSKIDQFESVFKSAAKTVFRYDSPRFKTICVVTDLQDYEHKQFVLQLRQFLRGLHDADGLTWIDYGAEHSKDLETLLQQIQKQKPDLLCTYRNLHSGAWRWPYSLGEHLHVFTQGTDIPVLVLPRPDQPSVEQHLQHTQHVMAITDHLSGDDRVINYAIALTASAGTLYLAHVENQKQFNTYIDIISKIPAIDTDSARSLIYKQLLKEPTDYLASCVQALQSAQVPVTIEPIVALGNPLPTYQFLLQKHQIHLLVLNTKDQQQMAMQNLAYALAVELRDIPMLLL